MEKVMTQNEYLVVGASHAGLAAIEAIRMVDSEGSITLLSREEGLPYSPTILPHVVSGRISPDRASLRSAEDLRRLGVSYRPGAEVTAVEPDSHRVRLSSGDALEYGKLLLATGSVPAVPPIQGLEKIPYRVLRTLDDAVRLREAVNSARSAVVLGGGLIGMHAAEILCLAGCAVAVVEGLSQILPGYFDTTAAGYLEKAFSSKGVRVLSGSRAEELRERGNEAEVILDTGQELLSDLLLVATGVEPAAQYLEGSGILAQPGVLVDERMCTSASGVWAAGDVAQARPFFGGEPAMFANIWNAVEQGRTAGLGMAGEAEVRPFEGSISAGISTFFDHRAFSIGLAAETGDGAALDQEELRAGKGYLKLVFQGDRLVGAAGIDVDLDPGIMLELVRRRVDLSGVRDDIKEEPRTTGRVLMSRLWG